MNREPNALDAIAYVGMKIAVAGAYITIALALAAFWIGTP